MRQTVLQASEASCVLQSSLSLTASGAFSEGALSRQSFQAVPGLQPSQGGQQTSQASLVVLAWAPPTGGTHGHGQAKCRAAVGPGLWSLCVPPSAGQCSCMQSHASLSICRPLQCCCLQRCAPSSICRAGGCMQSCAPTPVSQPAQPQAQLWSHAKGWQSTEGPVGFPTCCGSCIFAGLLMEHGAASSWGPQQCDWWCQPPGQWCSHDRPT